MDLRQFRRKIRQYRNEVGKSQEDLAHALGLAPVTLSNKLNSSNKLNLSRLEVKKVIKILAEWQALSSQTQILELLELMDCKAHDFTNEEWHTFPLDRLEVSPRIASKLKLSEPMARATNHNLPPQLTSFVGRQRELERLKNLFMPLDVSSPSALPEIRLVSLVGTGGIGKTRLALEIARLLVVEYPGGVWLVELANLSDPALVPEAATGALGLPQRGGTSALGRLVERLHAQPALLILDNCEHLLQACRELSDHLLEKCPNLKLLATSREGLGHPAETLFRVLPLVLPGKSETTALANLVEYDAIRLFVERAITSNSSFSLDVQNARALSGICRRLEGVPLAIELAAARTQLLTPDQIERRLDDYFRLLAASGRGRPLRHQTLRAVLDWSYNLLSAYEQLLWQRLSIFAGGWTLEAAEAVCAGPPLHSGELLDLVTGLINKSLVTIEAGAPDQLVMRYRMLEAIRQYGLEKLEIGTEEAELRDHHQTYFQGLVAEIGPQLRRGTDQKLALARLESELPNLRLDMEYAARFEATPTQIEVGLTMATGLGFFWLTRGYLTEAGEWFRKLLDRARSAGLENTLAFARACGIAGTHAQERGEYKLALTLLEQSIAGLQGFGDKAALAQAQGGLGILNAWLGNYEQSKTLFHQALDLQREIDELTGMAYSLNNLSNIAIFQSDYKVAMAYQEESLALRRKMGDKLGSSQSLNNLGAITFYQGEYATARRYWLEGLTLQREIGDKVNIASTLSNLGVIANFQRDFEEAHRLHEESLALEQEQGDKLGVASSISNLGMLALLEKDFGKAQSLLHQSLAIRRELNNKPGIAKSLNDLGLAALTLKDLKPAQNLLHQSLIIRCELGDKAGQAETLTLLAAFASEQSQHDLVARPIYQERACHLLGAARALLHATNRVLDLLAGEMYAQTFEKMRAELGQLHFFRLFEEGQAMSLEVVLNYINAWCEII